jgi:flagellar basal body rod protein FlgG
MVDMIETLRRYEAAQRALQAADESARYAANDMGRV